MNRIVDCFRFVFISPEVLVGLAVLLLSLVWPDFLEFFSHFAQSTDAAIVIGIITVPIGLLIGAYKLGESLLGNATAQGLVKWRDYWRLKYRVNFSGVVCVANLFSTLTAWYLVHHGKSLLGGALLLAGWAMAGASVITLGLTRIKLRDIMAAEELIP